MILHTFGVQLGLTVEKPSGLTPPSQDELITGSQASISGSLVPAIPDTPGGPNLRVFPPAADGNT